MGMLSMRPARASPLPITPIPSFTMLSQDCSSSGANAIVRAGAAGYFSPVPCSQCVLAWEAALGTVHAAGLVLCRETCLACRLVFTTFSACSFPSPSQLLWIHLVDHRLP